MHLYFTNKLHALVFSHYVKIKAPTSFRPNGFIVIKNFRSLLTTKIFFNDFDAYGSQATIGDELPKTEEHYVEIKKIVKYINRHSGWTMVGWYKVGGTTDTAMDGEIENMGVTVPLSSLKPSNEAITNSNVYKAKCLDSRTVHILEDDENSDNDNNNHDNNNTGTGAQEIQDTLMLTSPASPVTDTSLQDMPAIPVNNQVVL